MRGLLTVRKAAGLSQQEMARKLRISQQKLSMVERGKAKLTKAEQKRFHREFAFPDIVYDPCALLDEVFDMAGRLRVELTAGNLYKVKKALYGLGVRETDPEPQPLGDIELVFE